MQTKTLITISCKNGTQYSWKCTSVLQPVLCTFPCTCCNFFTSSSSSFPSVLAHFLVPHPVQWGRMKWVNHSHSKFIPNFDPIFDNLIPVLIQWIGLDYRTFPTPWLKLKVYMGPNAGIFKSFFDFQFHKKTFIFEKYQWNFLSSKLEINVSAKEAASPLVVLETLYSMKSMFVDCFNQKHSAHDFVESINP